MKFKMTLIAVLLLKCLSVMAQDNTEKQKEISPTAFLPGESNHHSKNLPLISYELNSKDILAPGENYLAVAKTKVGERVPTKCVVRIRPAQLLGDSQIVDPYILSECKLKLGDNGNLQVDIEHATKNYFVDGNFHIGTIWILFQDDKWSSIIVRKNFSIKLKDPVKKPKPVEVGFNSYEIKGGVLLDNQVYQVEYEKPFTLGFHVDSDFPIKKISINYDVISDKGVIRSELKRWSLPYWEGVMDRWDVKKRNWVVDYTLPENGQNGRFSLTFKVPKVDGNQIRGIVFRKIMVINDALQVGLTNPDEYTNQAAVRRKVIVKNSDE